MTELPAWLDMLAAVLVVVGVVLYLINNYVPMAAPIKTILNVVVVLAVLSLRAGIFVAYPAELSNIAAGEILRWM